MTERMERRFISVTGVKYGEETKGSTTKAIATALDAFVIWGTGGWQSGHHIVHNDGREYPFSFFRAGTFDGIPTYLFNMVISPVELFSEAVDLEKLGVANPFSLISINEHCLTTTPAHGAMSRIREILRGEAKKGTIGKGVGEAIKDAAISEDLAIHASDFGDFERVLEKATRIQTFKLQQALELQATFTGNFPEPAEVEMVTLRDHSIPGLFAQACLALSGLVAITDQAYLQKMLSQKGVIVHEGTHGALHHPWYGFVPHITQVDPTGHQVLDTLRAKHYAGHITRIAVSRTYDTRHGAGPLVSYDTGLTHALAPRETSNDNGHEWLGPFRCGFFDIPVLKYALAFSAWGHPHQGLALSHLDVLRGKTEWPVCVAYRFKGKAVDLDHFFYQQGGLITGIKVHPDTRDQAHYQHQLRLTQLVKQCEPVTEILKASAGKSMDQVFMEFVEQQVGIPVVSAGYGPATEDRFFTPAFKQILEQE